LISFGINTGFFGIFDILQKIVLYKCLNCLHDFTGNGFSCTGLAVMPEKSNYFKDYC